MKTLIQISDLHFGSVNESVLADLTSSINCIKPDLIIVSGDLTQRARSVQFEQAAAFLAQFDVPKIIVPGNHDIPLYNVVDRFVNPLEKYNRFITDHLMPIFTDDKLTVIGLNTARSLTIKDGRLNLEQITLASEFLRKASASSVKIVVTHHPLDVLLPQFTDDLAGNAKMAMTELSDAGADLFLSGHLHMGKMIHIYKTLTNENDRSVVMIQAGTACSTRSRNDVNSFNLIRVVHNRIELNEMVHSSISGFERAESRSFIKSSGDWQEKK